MHTIRENNRIQCEDITTSCPPCSEEGNNI